MEQLGKYGFLRRDYLKNHRNSTYQVMLLQDTIGEHLLEVDKAAREREEVILKQLEEKEPLPDKKADQMAQIFRVERTKNFTVMSNHHFKNKRLKIGRIVLWTKSIQSSISMRFTTLFVIMVLYGSSLLMSFWVSIQKVRKKSLPFK